VKKRERNKKKGETGNAPTDQLFDFDNVGNTLYFACKDSTGEKGGKSQKGGGCRSVRAVDASCLFHVYEAG